MVAQRAEPRRALPRRLLAERASLGLEIVTAYLRTCALRDTPINAAVAVLRTGSVAAEPAPVPGRLEEARRLGRAVCRTLRFLPGDTRCLVRSLVLTRLLARRGIPAKLVIAVRAHPEFVAHAWVEHEGQPVLEPGGESFGRLVEL